MKTLTILLIVGLCLCICGAVLLDLGVKWTGAITLTIGVMDLFMAGLIAECIDT